jgi:hypothetical protein
VSNKVKVFLCYTKEDLEKVEELYSKLEKEGFEPWLDKEDILPGQQWDPTIKQAIRGSDFFIACLSKNSVNKDGYLNREINEALKVWEEKAEDKI